MSFIRVDISSLTLTITIEGPFYAILASGTFNQLSQSPKTGGLVEGTSSRGWFLLCNLRNKSGVSSVLPENSVSQQSFTRNNAALWKWSWLEVNLPLAYFHVHLLLTVVKEGPTCSSFYKFWEMTLEKVLKVIAAAFTL
jgi:hypothetical protein